MESIFALIVVCLSIISIHLFVEHSSLPSHVNQKLLQRLMVLNNTFYSLASICMLVYFSNKLLPILLSSPPHTLYCPYIDEAHEDDSIDMVLRMYFYSKVYEGIDLILVSLRGFAIVHSHTLQNTPLYDTYLCLDYIQDNICTWNIFYATKYLHACNGLCFPC